MTTMNTLRFCTAPLLALLILVPGLPATAADDARISDLSYVDRQYMAGQRQLIGDLASLELGRGFNGDPANDLEILQLLLDRRVVRPDQTGALQAMGIILGDLLAADLDMQWVVYEDQVGRSRALRYRQSDEYLFPVTMISRRREVGNQTPVADIYQKARASITPMLSPRPYQ